MFYPKYLPIFNKKKEICQIIQNNQVVIISGETGSGKTTQIPKFCLEIGRGKNKFIGHTQPRRIAAKSIAERISKELKSILGEKVGYKIRFTDKISEHTSIKLMTDGILLSELYNDKLLLEYDTIIIDEAHERTLNIDFILGYLRNILPFRSDLKLIISSATINSELFSKYFNNAPIVKIEGKSYPIEVRYRPFLNFDKNSNKIQIKAIINAIQELDKESKGDIIVFLSNEMEIRNSLKEIKKLNLINTEILSIYSNLPEIEQNKVFEKHINRRIILATNIAETSLTIPGIKYVIDSGFARISRYNYKNKVQYLPIEPISQASANQRKGRCGRVSSGVCIRLYSKENFFSRIKDNDPEILRTNIASVILQMIAIGLGDIRKFSFIDSPNEKNIKYSINLLRELNAIESRKNDGQYSLTKIGYQLIKLPIDPHLGRMILEAKKYNCVKEIMIISAALSISDPREKILDKKEVVEKKHSLFVDSKSDFITFLKLWDFIIDKKNTLSKNDFFDECKKYFLNFVRIKEWFDVYNQLEKVILEIGISINHKPASYKSIHISLLAGLFLNIGKVKKNRVGFSGVFNNHFSIFPNSTLFKKKSNFIMVAKLIKTNKLWGLVAAKIRPEWVELVAKHLIKYDYSKRFWSKEKGFVVAIEQAKLFNLTLISFRQVNYANFNPSFCRRMFIQHVLIKGEWKTNFNFYKKNILLIKKIKKLENKLRRKDILINEKKIFSFYEKKIGINISSIKQFEVWWCKEKKINPNLLTFTEDFLMKKKLDSDFFNKYPDYWIQKHLKFKLSYNFNPGSSRDGVTVNIPIFLLNQVEYTGFDWNVPGFRKELIVSLIKLLPKKIKCFIRPMKNFLKLFLKKFDFLGESFLVSLTNKFKDITGIMVNLEDWKWNLLPDYLKINFCIFDEKNKILAKNRSLLFLKQKLDKKVREKIVQIFHHVERNSLKKWNFDLFPKICEKKYNEYIVQAYPAIVDKKNTVSIRLFLNQKEQFLNMKYGLRRLLLIRLFEKNKNIKKKIFSNFNLISYFIFFENNFNIIEDSIICGIDELILRFEKLAWTLEEYKKLELYVFKNFRAVIFDIIEKVKLIFSNFSSVNHFLKEKVNILSNIVYLDIQSQLDFLIFKGFLKKHGYRKLSDIVRYTSGIKIRLEKFFDNQKRDFFYMNQIKNIRKKWNNFLSSSISLDLKKINSEKINWMIEELRINLFAQNLGNSFPISEKRILKEIDKIKFLSFNYFKI